MAGVEGGRSPEWSEQEASKIEWMEQLIASDVIVRESPEHIMLSYLALHEEPVPAWFLAYQLGREFGVDQDTSEEMANHLKGDLEEVADALRAQLQFEFKMVRPDWVDGSARGNVSSAMRKLESLELPGQYTLKKAYETRGARQVPVYSLEKGA